MPTATTTIVRSDVDSMTSSVVALKTSSSTQVAESSTAATLRSLYPRAAKAFLQRDIALTHSLLTSAFALLVPPLYAGEDELSVHRRKWDILRITLETTVYASPPPSADPKAFPAALRANQMLSSQSLITSLHDRSLQLFTPNNPPTRPSPFFIPHQILVTLVLASVKLGCPEVGKSMIEDWLARKNPDVLSSDEGRLGYIKILELYCLHILPRLEEWEYAQDFLQYERELEPEMRAVSDPCYSMTRLKYSSELLDNDHDYSSDAQPSDCGSRSQIQLRRGCTQPFSLLFAVYIACTVKCI